MTVGELINELSKYDENTQIITYALEVTELKDVPNGARGTLSLVPKLDYSEMLNDFFGLE